MEPFISKNKVGERIKALQQNIKLSAPNNHYGCIQNKKKDYNTDYNQMPAPGLFKLKSTNLSKRET